MELKEFIKTYCNPVTSDDLIKTVNIFEDIEYEDYIEDINDIVQIELNNNIHNVPMLINNILLKHIYNILLDIGFTINKDLLNIQISELNDILEFLVDVKYSSKTDSEFMLHTLETYDDNIYAFSTILNKYIDINVTKLYEYIDNINSSYIKDLEDTLNNIINGDTETINNYDIVSVIRELKINDDQEILGLRILRDPYEEDSTLLSYLRNYIKDIYGKDNKETAINIISLLILSSDYRFDIMKGYVDIIENIIENENIKTDINNYIKGILPNIEKLYLKYNVGVTDE